MRRLRGMLWLWECRSLCLFISTGVAMLALLVGLEVAAFGQTTTGTITGTITDPKGAAMAGVNVVVHNADTGVDTPVKTNDSGIYMASLLQPGNYDLTVSQTGFATVEHK